MGYFTLDIFNTIIKANKKKKKLLKKTFNEI